MRLVKWEKTHDQKLGGWREEMGKGWGRAVVYVIYENGKKNRATHKVKCPGIAN